MELNSWLKTKLQQDIWIKKYQNENETLDEWFDRISYGNESIKELMIEKKFLPAGRILANRGLHKKGRKITLSNCYVATPPEDNLESIFECASKIARTFSYGGGIGVDISKLRPRGTTVNNAAKTTSGAVSFMSLYSLVTELIGQEGRRGALMISLDCSHPDLEEFIHIKSDLNKVTKANISIKITDEFMNAVKNNSDYTLIFYKEGTNEKINKVVNARLIFNKIAEMNWDYCEPGSLFWSRINNWNLLSNDVNFEYAGVNPCAEEPLPAGCSCLLGSINLSEFVVNPFTSSAYFDFYKFGVAVKESVTYLNEILDEGLELHPLQEQRDSVGDWRQIGLGIFGLADMLIKMGLKYGSDTSIILCDSIGYAMINYAIKQSAMLAKEYGSYPNYNAEAVLSSEFFKYNIENEEIIELVKQYGLRNSQLLTCAPTGSLSTMIGVSGGIEPIYELSYTRKTESLHGEDVYYTVHTPVVEDYLDFHDEDKDNLPKYFVTASTLNYKDRIDMQAIWQQHIDASISSTVNVQNDFTVEEVEDLYMYAWEKGLKGITIYRDGCKREGILKSEFSNEDDDEDEYEEEFELPRGFIEEVPEGLTYRKYKLRSGCGNLYFFVGVDDYENKIYDCFTNTDGVGGCMINTIANSRLLSASLRGGVPIEYLIEQLEKSGTCASYQNIRGRQTGALKIKDMISEYVSDEVLKNIDEYIGTPLSNGKSCVSAMSYVLKNIIKEFEGIDYEEVYFEIAKKDEILKNEKFECKHERMKMVEGCAICPDCGFSKCG